MGRFSKWLLSALLVASLVPALALAQPQIGFTVLEGEGNRVVLFFAQEQRDGDEEITEDTQNVLGTLNALLEQRFSQGRAAQLYAQSASRGGQTIFQREHLYQTEEIASIGLLWHGVQQSGVDGSSAYGLNVDMRTGEELTFEDLFADADAAAQAMERVMEREVLFELSDYLTVAELLPVPRDCFWFDESGLTVGYPSDRYRDFSGHCGTVHFAWHELASVIGEDSPLYELSRPQAADADAIHAALSEGEFGVVMPFGIGDRLGDALSSLTVLSDPDYTRDSGMGDSYRIYLFEESELRGWALEIPLYTETSEEETPISGVRSSCVDWHGLTTGRTTRAEIVALLGEPERVLVYDEEAARDAMTVPGESLVYPSGDAVLYAHVDEEGVLRTLTIRDGLPKDLPSWLYGR